MLELKDAPATYRDELSAEDSLARRVELSLLQCGDPELQNLEVRGGHGRILLAGRVRTYFLKQLAQTVILSLPGVTSVENHVAVG